MIQIRHVPEEIHRTLKSRAALEGMSMSDHVDRPSLHRSTRKSTNALTRAGTNAPEG